MYGRYTWDESLYNEGGTSVFAALTAVSTNTGSTRSPFGHILVAAPGGRLIFIWQSGAGLVYAVSSDGGETWGATRTIDTDTAAYASAIIDPLTNTIHVAYSNHGTPSVTIDESIYYRPLFYDSITADWVLGAEQQLAGGGGLYDPPTAGRRNASISATSKGRLVVTYLRSEAGVVTWAALVGQTNWSVADMDMDVDMGLAADEDSRGAAQQNISGTDIQWMVSRTGSTYSLSHMILPTPLSVIEAINVTTDDSWFGDSSEMIATAYGIENDSLGIVYLRNSKPRFRRYTLGALPALVSDTEMSTTASQSVSVTWDGARFWMAWVAADVIQVSNSDAPATVTQTWSNYGDDEDWSWLNSAVTETESPRIVFVWSQTNAASNTIYVGSFMSSRALSIAEAGTGTDTMTVTPTLTETGSGVDAMTAAEQKALTDTGAGVDALVSLRIPLTDTGVGTDVIGKGINDSETSSGTDEMVVRLTVAETGSGADAMTTNEQKALSDTGAGVDLPALRILLDDAGSGIEEASMGGPSAETGVGVDEMVIHLTGSDTGSGADTMTAQPIMTDSGTGVDDLGSVNKINEETGVGADEMTVRVTVAVTGVGVDSYTSAVPLGTSLTDSGTGVDAVSKIVIPTAMLVRLLVTSGDVKLRVEA